MKVPAVVTVRRQSGAALAQNPTFVSLFSGAGGLDLGFEEAGWHCLYAADQDPVATDTITRNKGKRGGGHPFRDTVVECTDVRSLSGQAILGATGRQKGDVVAMVGGPPCQSWSSAGHQLGLSDPRGQLFRDFVRIATEIDVRWLVFENVRGLLTARGPEGQPGGALALIREVLLNAGFQTVVDLVNAADFGVPQRRVRLIMVGFREGDRPNLPERTHARVLDLAEPGKARWVTLRQCLDSIEPPGPQEIIRAPAALEAQLRQLRPGSGLKSPGKTETTRPGGHWGYKQGAFLADLDMAARTVTASSQQDWIDDAQLGLRRLSPRDCAAIQTFPADLVFSGTRAEQYRQIGNAVPPVLAKAIAQSLKTSIEADAPAKRRSNTPPRELLPLPGHLVSAIRYTLKEEIRNGSSRKVAPTRRKLRASAP